MTLRFIFQVLLVCLFTQTISATDADNETSAEKAGSRIIGRVVDSQKNEMAFAAIMIENTSYSTITDANGDFQLANVIPGDYIISVRYLGYIDLDQEIKVEANKDLRINLVMDENSTDLDEAIVYGTATRGQAKSLNKQMNAISIKNIVSSEVFQTQADRNGAESLQRIPGISIDRNRGEGQNIQIRGISTEFNQVQLNGTPLPGGEDERGGSLDFLSADLMETIEVSKTLTPDMDGGAIGGTVNFVAKDAPEEGMLYAVSSGGYNFHADPFNDGWGLGMQNHSLSMGDRFFNNKLGVMVNGSYYQTNRGTVLNEYQIDDDDQLTRKRWNDYDVRRERIGWGTAADYKFNENNVLRFSYNGSYFNDDRRRGRNDWNFEYDENGEVSDLNEIRETQTRAKITNMNVFSLGGEHKFKNGIELDYRYSNVKSVITEPDGTQYYFARDVDPSNMQGRDPWAMDGSTIFDPNTPLVMNKSVRLDNGRNVEIDNSFIANLKVPYYLGGKAEIKTGYKYWDKSKERRNQRWTVDPLNNAEITMPTGTFYRRDLRYTDAEFKTIFDYDNREENYSVISNNYDAGERINAAYLMSTNNWTSKFTTLVGVRAEHTATSYLYDEHDTDTGEFIRRLEDNSSYVNLLPSFNAVYRFDRRTSLKAAYARGLSRPSFTALIPRENINWDNQTESLSNPDLKPVLADNFDLIFEKYTNYLGYFTVGAFAKSLSNQIYTTTYYEERNGEQWRISQPVNGGSSHIYGFETAFNQSLRNTELPILRWSSITANYTYTMSRQDIDIVDEEGDVIGERNVVMGNSPRDVANLIFTYDNPNSGFMFSIAGNYRGAMLISVDPTGNEMRDIYFSQQFHLDVAASYSFKKYYTVFTQMNNLTNQMEKEMYGSPYDSNSLLHQTEVYGPTISVGIRANF